MQAGRLSCNRGGTPQDGCGQDESRFSKGQHVLAYHALCNVSTVLLQARESGVMTLETNGRGMRVSDRSAQLGEGLHGTLFIS